jgi:hypothetical protein
MCYTEDMKQTAKLTGVYPDRTTSRRSHPWIAVWMAGNQVRHVILNVDVGVATRDEAMASAIANPPNKGKVK